MTLDLKAQLDKALAERDEARAALAKARAVALEEAAEAMWDVEVETHRGYERPDDGQATLRNAAAAIRALSKLSSSLVVLPRETVENIIKENCQCVECGEPGGHYFTTEGDGPYWLCDRMRVGEDEHGSHAMPERYAAEEEIEFPNRPFDNLRAALAALEGKP